MKNIFKLLPIVFVIVFAGCGGKSADEDSFVVKGNFTNTKKDSIYLVELTSTTMVPVDSTVITEDGDFYFKVKPKEIGFYLLKMADDNFVTLLIDKGETVEVLADAKQMLYTYSVSGSEGSELIWKLNQHKRVNLDKVDSLSAVYKASVGKTNFVEIKNSLDSTYEIIFNDEKEFAKNFIDSNINSLASLIAVYEQFGREMLFSEADSTDFIYFEKLDNSLMKIYKGNSHADEFHKHVSEVKRKKAEMELAESKLAIGNEAPDFELYTPDSTLVSLSSLKGKYVLIDFWASWCAPCRKNNPELVALYKKYKDRNFTILSVSLDREKDSWKKAIAKDKLTWTQVSDLKYWESPVAELYSVQEIPYCVLIDKEGKILAKSTEESVIEEKIAEVIR